MCVRLPLCKRHASTRTRRSGAGCTFLLNRNLSSRRMLPSGILSCCGCCSEHPLFFFSRFGTAPPQLLGWHRAYLLRPLRTGLLQETWPHQRRMFSAAHALILGLKPTARPLVLSSAYSSRDTVSDAALHHRDDDDEMRVRASLLGLKKRPGARPLAWCGSPLWATFPSAVGARSRSCERERQIPTSCSRSPPPALPPLTAAPPLLSHGPAVLGVTFMTGRRLMF